MEQALCWTKRFQIQHIMKPNKTFIFLGLLLVFASCAKKLTESDLPKVKRQKTQDLVAVLDSLSRDKVKTFYTKIATKYEDSTQSRSFKTSLRMIKDSAINTIIKWGVVPIGNALISKDSLHFVDKRAKCLVRSNMALLRDNFGVDFTYKNIEEVILGIPLDYDIDQKYFQIHEPHRYIVSSHKKRKLKKNERLLKNDRDVAIEYFINSSLNQLDGLKILSATDSTTINVSYLSRQLIAGINVPKDVTIQISTPRKNLFIEMTYTKVKVNEPIELYFIVPEGYEECE